jgi:hypothetical protein
METFGLKIHFGSSPSIPQRDFLHENIVILGINISPPVIKIRGGS